MSWPIRIRITAVRDEDGLQLVSGFTQAGEFVKDAIRLQGHGLSTHPPAGSLGIVAFLYGRRDMPTLIGIEHTDHRPKSTPEGGAVLYDHKGNKHTIVEAQQHIKHSTKIVLEAPSIVLKGNVDLGDEGGEPVDRTDNNPSTKVKAV